MAWSVALAMLLTFMFSAFMLTVQLYGISVGMGAVDRYGSMVGRLEKLHYNINTWK